MRIRSTAISQNVQKYISVPGIQGFYDSTQIEVRTGEVLPFTALYHQVSRILSGNPGQNAFEEGWSEIDHDIVYPYYKDDEMLTEFSGLLNRLSGMADEMSSYFRKMKELREEEPDKK